MGKLILNHEPSVRVHGLFGYTLILAGDHPASNTSIKCRQTRQLSS